MSRELEARVGLLVARLLDTISGYQVSMRQVVGVTLPAHVSGASEVLKSIEKDLPPFFERLKEEDPRIIEGLLQEEEEWGSVVLVDIIMEVFFQDVVEREPPQTVALILLAFFQDIQGPRMSPADAYYSIMGNLVVTVFKAPALMAKSKWKDRKVGAATLAYQCFLQTLEEILLLTRKSPPSLSPSPESVDGTVTL